MKGLLLHLANLVSVLLPQTRCFRLRARLYRLSGARVSLEATVNGTARIHHPNVLIGDDTWLGAGCDLIPTRVAGISIGRHVGVGPGVMFATGTHDVGETWRRTGPGRSEPIEIGDGCWIGARVTFIAGSGLGRSSVAAAGAVVTERFGDNVVVGGVPAKALRALPEPVSGEEAGRLVG